MVISDQQMPMVTGLEFLAQVKQVQPDATRILPSLPVLSLGTVIEAINKGEIYQVRRQAVGFGRNCWRLSRTPFSDTT